MCSFNILFTKELLRSLDKNKVIRDEPFNIYRGGGYQKMTKKLFAGGKSWKKIVCK